VSSARRRPSIDPPYARLGRALVWGGYPAILVVSAVLANPPAGVVRALLVIPIAPLSFGPEWPVVLSFLALLAGLVRPRNVLCAVVGVLG
jgi:hypothetical protein